jgi:release factor glutamine methyltransferase
MIWLVPSDHRASFAVGNTLDLASVTGALEAAGCVAAHEEAEALIQAADGDDELERMLARRRIGEPLAWLIGRANFCGLDIAIEPGVYVPRWQSESLALMAARLLPSTGWGVDICTGSGAIAMTMRSARPAAQVVATEIDPLAASCARRNEVVVYEGNLAEPLPAELASKVGVMIGVLPYVPNDALHLLPRDVQRFEPPRALDGGENGVELLSTVVRRSPRWIKTGGWHRRSMSADEKDWGGGDREQGHRAPPPHWHKQSVDPNVRFASPS